MDRVFKMVGECTIPEERREELNKHVINLLDRCGMRLMGKMDFKGTSVNVLKHLAPDSEGIVRFDYSIFQHEKVKDGSYDMKTCVINAPSSPFGVCVDVIAFVSALLEIYSTTPCYTTVDGMRINNELSLQLINNILNNKESSFKYYEIMEMINEDIFLGVWEDRTLKLSDEMKREIVQWKEEYKSIKVPDGFDMEKELLNLLKDIEEYWPVRYVSEEFVKEYTLHKGDVSYMKGILLLQGKANCYLEYFPELTRTQAMKWAVSPFRTKFDSDAITALIGALSGKKTRKEIFGF